MTVLVTGAAGFIGFHTAAALLTAGRSVVGVDSLNAYYDVRLKEARLDLLRREERFVFHRADVADPAAMRRIVEAHPDITEVVHLAAQAGVRHSLVDPYAYVTANVMAQVSLFEACRALGDLRHVVYASSSSVYGGNDRLPFSVADRVDRPVSVYAATKRAGELLGRTYAHLYGVPATGLRFFTVYGPWGRPDMAAYLFTRAIFAGEPIRVFNRGAMRRDFTFIDDIVAGVLAALDRPPAAGADDGDAAPHRLYNLGNNRPEELLHFIEVLEAACGRKAIKEYVDIEPGDVPATYADIEDSRRDLGFAPRTAIEDGLARFVAWFRDYHGV